MFYGAKPPDRCCFDVSSSRSMVSDVHPFLSHAHGTTPRSPPFDNSYRRLEDQCSTSRLDRCRHLSSGFLGVSVIKLTSGSHLGEVNEALLGGLHTLNPVYWRSKSHGPNPQSSQGNQHHRPTNSAGPDYLQSYTRGTLVRYGPQPGKQSIPPHGDQLFPLIPHAESLIFSALAWIRTV